MDQQIIDILSNASDVQQQYVKARLTHDSVAKAALSLNLHRSTPHKWDNLDDLERAVALLQLDLMEATRIALENELLEAVAALARGIRGKGATSVAAAKAILDRAGFPAQTAVDVTSGGEPIRATIYIPDNGRD